MPRSSSSAVCHRCVRASSSGSVQRSRRNRRTSSRVRRTRIASASASRPRIGSTGCRARRPRLGRALRAIRIMLACYRANTAASRSFRRSTCSRVASCDSRRVVVRPSRSRAAIRSPSRDGTRSEGAYASASRRPRRRVQRRTPSLELSVASRRPGSPSRSAVDTGRSRRSERRVEAGADRVMVGTAALEPAFLDDGGGPLRRQRSSSRSTSATGVVASDGWTRSSEVTAVELAARCAAAGVRATARDEYLAGRLARRPGRGAARGARRRRAAGDRGGRRLVDRRSAARPRPRLRGRDRRQRAPRGAVHSARGARRGRELTRPPWATKLAHRRHSSVTFRSLA